MSFPGGVWPGERVVEGAAPGARASVPGAGGNTGGEAGREAGIGGTAPGRGGNAGAVLGLVSGRAGAPVLENLGRLTGFRVIPGALGVKAPNVGPTLEVGKCGSALATEPKLGSGPRPSLRICLYARTSRRAKAAPSFSARTAFGGRRLPRLIDWFHGE